MYIAYVKNHLDDHGNAIYGWCSQLAISSSKKLIPARVVIMWVIDHRRIKND
jgi:hypothetical protein